MKTSKAYQRWLCNWLRRKKEIDPRYEWTGPELCNFMDFAWRRGFQAGYRQKAREK